MILVTASCASPLLPKPTLSGVGKEFAARLTDGTALLLGRARLPVVATPGASLSEEPAAGATVVLLARDFKTEISRATTDGSGNFRIQNVPRGGASILRITHESKAGSRTIEKLVFPTTSVECVRVDLASSLLVDKIASNGLLKPDPLLSGRDDLLDLVQPDKLANFEKDLRDQLAKLPTDGVNDLLDEALKPTEIPDPTASPSPGTGSGSNSGGGPSAGQSLLDRLGQKDENVAENYNDIFVRPDEASLTFNISAIGFNDGVAKDAQRISGVVSVNLTGMPADVSTCELWTIYPERRLLVTLSDKAAWAGEFDSWPIPQGPTNLDFIGITVAGKRVLQRLPVIIDNSVSELCAE
ncbi:MAG: carboxypeptidase-like regulatory domain-containing protein [bacterium]|nr:carboxypeptidase-like regulatory domain-containing protein [bacterium]